jgi:hypothetical protein
MHTIQLALLSLFAATALAEGIHGVSAVIPIKRRPGRNNLSSNAMFARIAS